MAIQENKFKSRAKRYTFFSQGTPYSFDPQKSVSSNGKLTTSLQFHKSEVRFRNRKDTFILDESGKYVPVS